MGGTAGALTPPEDAWRFVNCPAVLTLNGGAFSSGIVSRTPLTPVNSSFNNFQTSLMSLSTYLLRFFLAYTGLMVLAWIMLVLLRFDNFIGLDVAMLFGAITIVSTQFAKKNGRYFSDGEKTRAIFGMLSIDLLLQLLLSLLPSMLPGAGNPSVKSLFIMLAIVGCLHLLTISLFVTLERRFLVKKGLIEA